MYAVFCIYYRTDARVLAAANLEQNLLAQKKGLIHAALIFNRMRAEIELEEISRIAAIVAFLVQLKCQVVTIYDKEGSIKEHAKLIQALLRIQLATLGANGLFND